MCGISGVMVFNGSDKRILGALKRMSDSHSMRGPDDEGYFTVNKEGRAQFFFGQDTPIEARKKYNLSELDVDGSTEAFLGLSHRRLSILDLSDEAHQPMTYGNGQYVLVYNGEIYNYLELKKELTSYGYHFRSNSDSEVILAAYAKWGKKCVEKFNGDFAFAIWDFLSRSLFCARDRVGIKPFYYHLTDWGVIFGSDIKTIIASKLYKPEISNDGIYYSMAYGMAPRPLTAFKGIYALKPSSTLTFNEFGKTWHESYWKIPTNQQDNKLTERESIEMLENALTESTRLRMRSDVEVGTFMSGGVDSTLISALAKKESPTVKAFTLGFNGQIPKDSEIEEAKLAAKHIQISHIIKYVDSSEIIPKIGEMIKLYEEPYYDLSPTLLISEEVKKNNIKVILNGLGGDEIFGGYGYYKYHNMPSLKLPDRISHLFQRIGNERLSKGLLLLASGKIEDLHNIGYRCSNDYHLNRLFALKNHPKKPPDEMLADLYLNNLEFTDRIEATCYLDLVNYIGNHFVHRVDQFTMYNSIEGRFPFLDHNVIEAGFKIPSKFKVKDGKLKWIVKQLAEKYIPHQCISMKKKGFSFPLGKWMEGQLKKEVHINIINLMQREIINPDYVKQCYEEYMKGKFSNYKIWHMVSLELWLKEFID